MTMDYTNKACGSCGRINDAWRKFCGGCGVSMTAVTLRVRTVPEGTPMEPQLAPRLVRSRAGLGAPLKLGLLLVVVTLILVGIGSLLGPGGAALFLAFAVLLNFGAFWFSDSLILLSTGAKEVSPERGPQLHEIVGKLAAVAGMPKPRIYLMDSPVPNAFATGRSPSRAVVAVTRGLLDVLNRHELEAVLAHELGHVVNRDMLISSVVACLCGAVMVLASIVRWGSLFAAPHDERKDGPILLVVGLFAPIGALLVRLGISRARELRADETGAALCGKPHALASALTRIEQAAAMSDPMRISPQAAHLFLVPPLPKGWLATLFSTHPATSERVRRLRKMSPRF